MFLDCLHYQVDFIGGDPDMGLHRYSGTRQESMDIKGGMYQSTLNYFLEAWAEARDAAFMHPDGTRRFCQQPVPPEAVGGYARPAL